MTLNQHIENVVRLRDAGHGEKQIFARHGTSGAVDEVGNAHLSNLVGESGPFDLQPGEAYVSLYIGN